jgi:ligand-binding sensor domain-containing protein
MKSANKSSSSKSQKLLLAGGVTLAAVIGFVWFSLRQADQALSKASQQIAESQIVNHRWTPFRRNAPTSAEWLVPTARFVGAVEFDGQVWIANASSVQQVVSSAAPGATSLSKSASPVFLRAGADLPGSPITALAVGTLGKEDRPQLWIATRGAGIVAYNGKQFRHLQIDLQANAKVHALSFATDGNLWLATDDGILIFDGTVLRRAPAPLDHGVFTHLLIAQDAVYASGGDRGLILFSGGQSKTINKEQGLPDSQILTLTSGGTLTSAVDQEILVGTPLGAAILKSGLVVKTVARDRIVGTAAYQNGWWISGPDSGLLHVQENGSVSVPSSVSAEILLAMPQAILFANAQGISIWRDRRLEMVAASLSSKLVDAHVSTLAMDDQQRLWIGYFDQGLQVLDAAGNSQLKLNDGKVFCVNKILSRGEKTWVATANGLAVFNESLQMIDWKTQKDGLISSHVTDLAFDNDSLIAATPAGVTWLDREPESIYVRQGLVNNHVYSLTTWNRSLVAGTLGGISIIKDRRPLENFTTTNSPLRSNWISALATLGRTLFVGTYGGGVSFAPSTTGNNRTDWRQVEGIPQTAVINPGGSATSDRAVYFGTLDQGLFQVNADGRAKQITDGLPSRNITAVLAHQRKIYIGSDNGLTILPEP